MSKDQLTHIRELIKQKQYDVARQQLVSLSKSGHPIAQKWLANLNQIAPPQQTTPDDAKIGNYLDTVQQQKIQLQKVEAQEKAQRRRFGCVIRSVMALSIICILTFVLGPMLLAAGIVSNNPQLNRVTSEVMSVIEDQQSNVVGRTVTRVYAETSGRLTEALVVSNMDRICDMAAEHGANQGITVTRADCEEVVREASVCVTDQLVEAQQCLRRYVMNRCLTQVGTSAQGQAYCDAFVAEHMGAAD